MNDHITLSNSKKIYANCGIVGLGIEPADGEWHPSEGYDGGLATAAYSEYFEPSDGDYGFDHITKAEMLELCDIMIKRWQDFKAYVETKEDKTR